MYKKWILQKYPQAANYVWETTHSKINAPVIKIGNKSATINDIPRMLYQKFSNFLGLGDNSAGMNPLGKYLKENNQLREVLYDYFSYMDSIPNKEIKEVIREIKDTGSSVEKIQAVSLLAALKAYFNS